MAVYTGLPGITEHRFLQSSALLEQALVQTTHLIQPPVLAILLEHAAEASCFTSCSLSDHECGGKLPGRIGWYTHN